MEVESESSSEEE